MLQSLKIILIADELPNYPQCPSVDRSVIISLKLHFHSAIGALVLPNLCPREGLVPVLQHLAGRQHGGPVHIHVVLLYLTEYIIQKHRKLQHTLEPLIVLN